MARAARQTASGRNAAPAAAVGMSAKASIGRRSFLLAGGLALYFPPSVMAAPEQMNLLTAPLELAGDWGGSPSRAAAVVITRMRQVSLAGVTLISDRQPDRLRVDDHASGPPAIWLHVDPPGTAWVIVDIGPRDWCKLAYQFGHELGHVLCNSWQWSAKPAPPSQWVEESLAEAFSIRGLGLLAASWERDPPFPGDSGFAKFIRQYRADLTQQYRAAAPPGPDVAACYRTHCRDFTQGKGDPVVFAVLSEMESDPLCVEDLGALNRWPARSGAPVAQYLTLWQKSCAELGASGRLPARLRVLLGLD
jgi:hypothetical protein